MLDDVPVSISKARRVEGGVSSTASASASLRTPAEELPPGVARVQHMVSEIEQQQGADEPRGSGEQLTAGILDEDLDLLAPEGWSGLAEHHDNGETDLVSMRGGCLGVRSPGSPSWSTAATPQR